MSDQDNTARSELSDSDRGGIISALTGGARLFLFSYSPEMKSLLSWSGDMRETLGTEYHAINRDANLFLRYVHPEDRFLLLSRLERALKGEEPYRATYRWIRPDTNETRWLHCRGVLTTDEQEQVFEGMVIDITDDLQFTGHGAGPLEQVSSVLAASQDFSLTVDRDLRISHSSLHPVGDHSAAMESEANPSWFNFGDPSFQFNTLLPGRPLLDCFGTARIRTMMDEECRKILSGNSVGFRTRVKCGEQTADLSVGAICHQDIPQGLLFTARDITRSVELESIVRNLQKTEGLRVLAMGLAHNFNNALQSILGQALALRANLDQPARIQQAADIIAETTQRAAHLTQQLVKMDDHESSLPAPVDLNLAAMSAIHRIEDLFANGLKVSVAFGNPPVVIAVHREIEGLIENILRGLRNSMNKEVSVSIATAHVRLGIDEHTHLEAGAYARMTISETSNPAISRPFGSPLSESLREAAARADSLGGYLDIHWKGKKPISLVLYLPVSREAAVSAASKYGDDTMPCSEGSPAVLIVDDDLLVLETVHSILTSAGYSCVSAADYRKALDLARIYRNSLKLILLDVLMPDMDGVTLLGELKKIYDGFHVIGFSGAPKEISHQLLDKGAAEVLEKPVQPDKLIATVRSVLSMRKAV